MFEVLRDEAAPEEHMDIVVRGRVGALIQEDGRNPRWVFSSCQVDTLCIEI